MVNALLLGVANWLALLIANPSINVLEPRWWLAVLLLSGAQEAAFRIRSRNHAQ